MDSSQFFYRNVIFSQLNNKVSIVDIYNPNDPGKELDQWMGLVLLHADGQHTVKELFENLSAKYNGNPPDNLKETIYSVLERLAEMKFIVLTEKKTELAYYLAEPAERLDLDKAKKMIDEDKIKHQN